MSETASIATLPRLPFSERAALPDCPGVYFLVSPSDEVLYVGRTVSLAHRWQSTNHHQHRHAADCHIAWLEAGLGEIAVLESIYIYQLRPRLNGPSASLGLRQDPSHTTKRAVGQHIPEVARELRITQAAARRMISSGAYDPHGRSLAFHRAVFRCNPPGADLLFEDYQAFHESLKAGESVKVTKEEAVAEALHAVAEFVKGEERDFDTKAANAIRAIRFLMVTKKRAAGV